MRLFLTGSGERSKAVGALSRELETVSFAVGCVTPANLQAPWLLHEAETPSKSLQGRLFTALQDPRTPACCGRAMCRQA